MTDDTLDMLGHAVEWACAGGRLARERFGSATASRKADQTLVTDADHAVQALIVDAIARQYPGHAVFTEETLHHPERHTAFTAADWCWVIDPIDGTRNYWRGVPSFGVSIGVLYRGEPAVGVVHDVMLDRTYRARVDGGAWRDEVRLRVVDEPPTCDTNIGAPAGQGDPMPKPVHEWLDRMSLRNLGATSLHLALLAAGAMDAAFCLKCKLWDIAAGALLVTEAGGTITDLQGRPYFPLNAAQAPVPSFTPFLAAGPNLHRLLLESWTQGT